MDALIKAKTGIYCAPLRLLAWEVRLCFIAFTTQSRAMKGYERLRNKHVKCSLLTGQESEGTAVDCTHISCTMEMTNLSKIYEVSMEI